MKFITHPHKFTSYRNIATCSPTQNLFDDLVSDRSFGILQQAENATSEIDHAQPKLHRPFQYSDRESLIVFDKLHWTRGRFSLGNHYGVWYGALEESTSEQEILYHKIRESRELFKNPKITSSVITHQRVMLRAKCVAKKLADLRRHKTIHAKLISENYTFCQHLGAQAIAEDIEAFFTPSARHRDGTCTPVFNPVTIQKDEVIYYFDFIVARDLQIQKRRSLLTTVAIPDTWTWPS